MIVLSRTCYNTIFGGQCNSVNINCELGRESQIRSNSNCASSVNNTIRPFNKMVTLCRCSSQCHFCAVIIFSCTYYNTIFGGQCNIIYINRKLSTQRYIRSNYNSASSLSNTIRPSYKVVACIWCRTQCRFCAVIIFASTHNSTISCRKSNSINIDCKFGSESQVRSNRNGTCCIYNTIRPLNKMMPLGWSSSEGKFCTFWIYSTSSNRTTSNCRSFYIKVTYKLFQINS